MQKLSPIDPGADGRRSLQTCWRSVFCCGSRKKHWKVVTDTGDPAMRQFLPPQGNQGKLDLFYLPHIMLAKVQQRWHKLEFEASVRVYFSVCQEQSTEVSGTVR